MKRETKSDRKEGMREETTSNMMTGGRGMLEEVEVDHMNMQINPNSSLKMKHLRKEKLLIALKSQVMKIICDKLRSMGETLN